MAATIVSCVFRDLEAADGRPDRSGPRRNLVDGAWRLPARLQGCRQPCCRQKGAGLLQSDVSAHVQISASTRQNNTRRIGGAAADCWGA